jgi:hypothetical protein
MTRTGPAAGEPKKACKMLICKDIKFMKNEDFPCFFGPFFGTIFSWKTTIGPRDAEAPGARIFLSVNGHDTREVHR